MNWGNVSLRSAGLFHGVRGTRWGLGENSVQVGGDSCRKSQGVSHRDCSPVQPTAPHHCRHLWVPQAPQQRSPLPLLFSDESPFYVCLGSCPAPAVTVAACPSLPYHVFVQIPGTINCSNICRDVLVLPEWRAPLVRLGDGIQDRCDFPRKHRHYHSPISVGPDRRHGTGPWGVAVGPSLA